MKKFLSLVLALIMTMSLVTVSAGAKDFTDDEKINYEEAVAVMSEVKVLDGYTDGSFKPQAELTRGAAAKIICNMILGPTTAAELHADTAPYKDVPVDHTFAGYIAYCAKEGIISGYADGTFRPAAPLTGYAFMKMLLGALGYDQDVEGFTGANWSINVAKRALGIGLNAGLKTEFSGIKSVTREEAALYAFNTLCATMVDYDSKTTVTVGGAEVVVAGSTAKDVLWTGTRNADGNVKDDNKVQFAEKYFSKLIGKADQDAFGRPATTWVCDKKEIGTYVDYELLVADYTKKVKGGDVYADTSIDVDDYDTFEYYINGKPETAANAKAMANLIAKKNKDTFADSAKGRLVEVYSDTDDETLTIVVVDTYLAEVTADYSEKNETLKIEYYKAANGLTKTVKLENVPNLADFEEDDMVLVTIADGVVMSMAKAEMISDVTISSFSTDGTNEDQGVQVTELTADGTKYDAACQAWYKYDFVSNYDLKKIDDCNFNLYLDPYGYVIGVEDLTASTNYVFVVGIEASSNILSKATYKANLITVEGEMVPATVKLSTTAKTELGNAMKLPETAKVINTWFECSVNDEGVYTLDKQVAFADDKLPSDGQLVLDYDKDTEINDVNNTLMAIDRAKGEDVHVYGNNKSVYVTVDVDDVTNDRIEDVDNVTTGIKNVDIKANGEKLSYLGAAEKAAANVYALYHKGFVVCAIVIGEDANTSDTIAYITSTKVVKKTYDKENDVYFYTYDCIIDGEETTIDILSTAVLKEADGDNNQLDNRYNILSNRLYKVTKDGNGYGKVVTEIYDNWAKQNWVIPTLKGDNHAFAVYGVSKVLVTDNGTLNISENLGKNTGVILDDECVFWVKNTDDAVIGEIDHDGEFATDGWEKFTDVDDALDALGNNGKIDNGNFVIIADKDTGYATCIIITDTFYAINEDAVEEEPTVDGSYGVYAIAGDRSWPTTRTGTNNFVFGFSKYNAETDAYEVMTAADIVSLGLKASDFTVTINGETYVGKKIVTFSAGTTPDLDGYIKVNFGEDEIILNGFRYQETDGTVNENSNIDFSFSVNGVKVSQAKTLIETGLANFG